MAFEDDLIVRLVARGVGVYGTSIFVSSKAIIPDGAGPYLSITATGGAGPLRTQNAVATPAYQRPSAQLVARATTYAAAKTMARAAYDALVGVRNEAINGVYYREINPVQEPFDLGLDVRGRACSAFNVSCVRRPS
jgi:hypothetical protein